AAVANFRNHRLQEQADFTVAKFQVLPEAGRKDLLRDEATVGQDTQVDVNEDPPRTVATPADIALLARQNRPIAPADTSRHSVRVVNAISAVPARTSSVASVGRWRLRFRTSENGRASTQANGRPCQRASNDDGRRLRSSSRFNDVIRTS